MIELGVLSISGAPFTKRRGSAPYTSFAEDGGKNDFSERVECGGVALEVRCGSSVRASNDDCQWDCRGERREERSPRQREGGGRHGMTMESPRAERQSGGVCSRCYRITCPIRPQRMLVMNGSGRSLIWPLHSLSAGPGPGT